MSRLSDHLCAEGRRILESLGEELEQADFERIMDWMEAIRGLEFEGGPTEADRDSLICLQEVGNRLADRIEQERDRIGDELRLNRKGQKAVRAYAGDD